MPAHCPMSAAPRRHCLADEERRPDSRRLRGARNRGLAGQGRRDSPTRIPGHPVAFLRAPAARAGASSRRAPNFRPVSAGQGRALRARTERRARRGTLSFWSSRKELPHRSGAEGCPQLLARTGGARGLDRGVVCTHSRECALRLPLVVARRGGAAATLWRRPIAGDAFVVAQKERKNVNSLCSVPRYRTTVTFSHSRTRRSGKSGEPGCGYDIGFGSG